MRAFLAAAALLAPAPSPSPLPPNVLLITVDTLRPDALGWVAGRNETPALDALAGEGFRFPAAVAPVPLTLPSHSSLLTGLLPRHHGVRDNGQVLPAAVPTLAQRLHQAGYATAAFVSGYPLRSLFGLDRGFDRYEDSLPVGAEGWRERPAPDTTALALAWLKTARPPWFLWVHYYDPHDPYTPPRAFWKPGRRGAYDGEVAAVDHAIGTLRAGLGSSKDGLLTVMAADHGEALGEHGEATHGFFVYDSTLLVPLVFSSPGRVPPGESRSPARLVDVAPTILALLGLPPLADTDGISLVPTLAGRAQSLPAAYLETRQPWIAYGWAPLKAIRSRDFKLIEAPRRELFDLAADPSETRNIVPRHGERVAELSHLMARVEARPEAGSRSTQDPEVMEQLRALGYLGASATSALPPPNLADPKDRLPEHRLLTQGEGLLRAGDFAGALRAFDAVLVRDPENRFATLRSGIAYLKQGQAVAAVTRLQRAVAQDPLQAETHYALADALMRLQNWGGALAEWMETVRLQPRRAAAWSNLGTALGRLGRFSEATRAFARAAELEPANGAFGINLGFAQRASGDEAAAVRAWQKAAAGMAPGEFPAAGSLGLGLIRLGRREDALPWLEAARADQVDFAEARLEAALSWAGAGQRERAVRALRQALDAEPRLKDRALSNPLLRSLLP